jgi:hypothetical protein
LTDIRRLLKNIITAGILTGFVLIAMLAILPVPARAEMANNLSNAGCASCHTGYPGTQPTSFAHETTNCTRCHSGMHGAVFSVDKMWNCRYCHLTTYTDTYSWPQGYHDESWIHGSYTGTVSGFKSWRDPLRGAPLGSKLHWMASHFSGGTFTTTALPSDWPIDANFVYHQSSQGYQHISVFPDNSCSDCHKNTLTAEHEGKTSVITNPTENFEDGSFAFNFTGFWGGDWARSNDSVYTGVYSFKSGMIAIIGGLTTGPPSVAVTETTVNVGSNATVSFVYKVTAGNTLIFSIDGTQVLSGASTAWISAAYPLTAGTHTIKWSTAGNSAYIDDISVTGATTTYTMDCNTCHLSSDTSVKAAITNHSTNCSACHSAVDHEALHNGSLDISCQKCHKQVLTQEHMNNPVTTAGKNFDCNTCHSNTTSQVQRSLALGDLNCAGCHSTLHNFGAAEKTPADIPLYTGFSWTTPMDTAIFAGEPNIPSGFEQGWVLISNRKTDVTCLQVRNFYKTRAAVLGWTVGSDSAPSSATVDTIQFTKQNRMLVLRVYNTKLADGTGQQGLGYRIELWYK